MALTTWLPATATVIAATITSIVAWRAAATARRASDNATKIAKEGAEKAMEIAKAQRADPLAQQVFAAKLQAYQRLMAQLGTATGLAILELRELRRNPPGREQETWLPLLEATNELARIRVADGFLYSNDAVLAAAEMSEPLFAVMKLPYSQKLDQTKFHEMALEIGNVSFNLANAIREDLKIPAIATLTGKAIDLGSSFASDDAWRNRRAG